MKDNQNKTLGIGVIGYNIGRVHMNSWKNLPLYVCPPPAIPSLISISGRNKESVSAASKLYGSKRYHTDWRDLVNDPEVQVVDNCTPPNLHEEICVNAAERGKHILCEKPLARNSGEAERILRAAEKAGILHMVGFNFRFVPAIMHAKKLIDEGYIGRLFHFRGVYHSVEMGEEGFVNPNEPANWHMNKDIAGSGALHDLGTHVLDMARLLMGEPVSVSAASQTFIKERPVSEGSNEKCKVTVDDATVAAIKFANGALGTFEASWMTPGRKDYLGFEINGSQGSLRFNVENMNELEVYSTQDRRDLVGFKNVLTTAKMHPTMDRYWPYQGTAFGWEYSFINQTAHLVDSIINEKPIEPIGSTFYDGYRNCLIMDAILRSADKGTWETIP